MADSGGPRGTRPRRASSTGSQYSGTGSQTRPCRLPSRVAGSLLLLFAQPVTRIVRLTMDDVVQVGDHTALRLGDPPTPSHSPECLPRGSAQHDHRHQLRLLLALPQPPRRTGHGPGALRDFDVPAQRARSPRSARSSCRPSRIRRHATSKAPQLGARPHYLLDRSMTSAICCSVRSPLVTRTITPSFPSIGHFARWRLGPRFATRIIDLKVRRNR